MDRIESKSITCKPAEENATIEKFQRFGWALESSQEIFNKDSHLELRGNTQYSVTETTNYVKLVFKRDKDMPYYNEIVVLENKYDSVHLPAPETHSFLRIITLIGAIAFLVIGSITMFTGGAGIAIGIILDLLGIGCIVVRSIISKKDNDAIAAVRYQESNMRQKILDEVARYV